MSDILLTPSVRNTLFAHARDGAENDPPREVCGVLGGRRGHENPDVDLLTRVERVRNVADHPRTEYELDPAETIAAIDEIEGDGDDHVGFYHSHPDGPRGPSRTDRTRATWPGYVYLIVSLPESVIGAWRWTGDRFDQLRIEVRDPDTGARSVSPD